MQNLEFNRERIMEMIQKEWTPVKWPLNWKCIRCGKCCNTSWRVNLTWVEYHRLINDPGIKEIPEFEWEVDPDSGLDHPFFIIDGVCPILKEGNTCTAYPDWFFTCATYPFLMMPDGSVMKHDQCSGFGSGDLLTVEMVRDRIIHERKRAGMIIRTC